MSVEKYINENGEEVTILHNGTKEFDEFWSRHCHPFDYSHIIPGEICPYSKDEFAQSLGLTRNKDSEEFESLLSTLYIMEAQKGPITSWFYNKCTSPELYPVYFEVDVLDGYIFNPKYTFHNFEFGGRLSVKDEFISQKNLLSRPIRFGLAYSEDKKKRAIVAFGQELITLDEYDQNRWIKHLIDSDNIGANSSFIDYVKGDLNDRHSVFIAILDEIFAINKICNENSIPQMFHEDFKNQYSILMGYHVIFQPTKFNLMRFASAMYKIIIQNLVKTFFEFENDVIKKGNKNEDINKVILSWIIKNNITGEIDDFKNKCKSIAKIANLRDSIAHHFEEDDWNEEYWKTQKEIIFDVYDCLRTIREGLYNKLLSKIEIPYGIEEIRNIVMY